MIKPSAARAARQIYSTDHERLTWAQTRSLIRSDFLKLCEWYGGGSFMNRAGWFMQPNYQCLFLYRLYRYLYLKGWRTAARLLFLFSLYFTTAEISPKTSIGHSCLIAHASNVILFGKIGNRVSIYGQGGTGGGFSDKDIGGGPGYPVVGDDVVFGIKAVALGPIRIGDRATLAPTTFVRHDMPDDALALEPASRVRLRKRRSLPAATGIPPGRHPLGTKQSGAQES